MPKTDTFRYSFLESNVLDKSTNVMHQIKGFGLLFHNIALKIMKNMANVIKNAV